MAAKKRSVKQEPLLNTVARKLGHAAGRLTKVTQRLTENLSALPETVTTQVREAAHIGTQPGRSSHSRRAKKKHRTAVRGKRAKAKRTGAEGQGSIGKTRRSNPKTANRKK
jgi:hypothetical protein